MLVMRLNNAIKRKIKKVLVIDGKEISVEFAPSRAITQIEKYCLESHEVIALEDLSTGDMPWEDYGQAIVYDDIHRQQIGINWKFYSSGTAKLEVYSNMLKALALFTTEEVMREAIAEIPRKKDGWLHVNRNTTIWQMDGLFRDAGYYIIKGKSTSANSVEFTVSRETANAFFSVGHRFDELNKKHQSRLDALRDIAFTTPLEQFGYDRVFRPSAADLSTLPNDQSKVQWINAQVDVDADIRFKNCLFTFSGFGYDFISGLVWYEIERRGGEGRREVLKKSDFLVVNPACCGTSKIDKALEWKAKGSAVKIVTGEMLAKALKRIEPLSDEELERMQEQETTQEPKKEPKQEPKKEPKKETTQEPKQEPKQQAKQEPKKEPKKETTQEPKKEPKQQAKQEPKQQAKQEPKKETTQEPKKEPKQGPKQEPKKEPKQEPKQQAKQGPKKEPKKEPKQETTQGPKQEFATPKDRFLAHKTNKAKQSGEAKSAYARNVGTTVFLIDGRRLVKCWDKLIEYCTVPEEVEEIGDSAFTDCRALNTVILPAGLITIGRAFRNRTTLEHISLPCSLRGIQECAFEGCSSLKEIGLPDELTTIGQSAFAGCSSLEELTIPEGVTEIPNSAFSGCETLKRLVLPRSVVRIGEGAFFRCSSLEGFDIPEGITSIETKAFWNCSALGAVRIPDGVASIGAEAFNSCKSLETIEIPASVREIGERAFSFCDALKAVRIPDGVISIGAEAFNPCKSLETIEIPASVREIGGNAFFVTRNLTVTVPRECFAAEYARAHDIDVRNTQEEDRRRAEQERAAQERAGREACERKREQLRRRRRELERDLAEARGLFKGDLRKRLREEIDECDRMLRKLGDD